MPIRTGRVNARSGPRAPSVALFALGALCATCGAMSCAGRAEPRASSSLVAQRGAPPSPSFEDVIVPHGAYWEGVIYDRFVVRFVGNVRAPGRELADTMLATKGILLDEVLERDALFLQAWYYDHGYVQVRIAAPTIEPLPEGGGVRVTVVIDEGEPFVVSSIDVFEVVAGTPVPSPGWNHAVAPGTTFNRRLMFEALQHLTREYRDLGFAHVEATPITRLDETRHRIAIAVPVVPGQLCRFGRISFSGAKTVSESLLLERLSVKAGELYGETELEKSRQRLLDTGWFERVDLVTKVGVLPDLVDLSVEVDEAHVPMMTASTP